MKLPRPASVKKHLSYANVIASLALFLALGGGVSYAAGVLPGGSVTTWQLKDQAVTLSKMAPTTIASLKGNAGAQGAMGPVGIAGANGTDGTDGSNGTNGIDGQNGTDGQNGVGVTGATGVPGVPGQNGNDGAPGLDGQPGQNGDSGPTGQDGQDGQPGQDGQRGATGATGAGGSASTIYAQNRNNGSFVIQPNQFSTLRSVTVPAGSYKLDGRAQLINFNSVQAAPTNRVTCAIFTGQYVDTADATLAGHAPNDYEVVGINDSLSMQASVTFASQTTVQLLCYPYSVALQVNGSISALKLGSIG
jgi:hypothetical protein